MTPTQRAAAVRMADVLDRNQYDAITAQAMGEAAALLRELACEQDDPMPGMSHMNRTIAYCAADTLRKLGYEWGGEAWVAAEPVQEPAIWIQSNHLQHAKNGPHFARTGPTKLQSDYVPLYTAPQQRRPLDSEAIQDLKLQVVGKPFLTVEQLVRRVEFIHGIGEAP